ncbi:Dom-3 Z [Chamberlinius hualienensis]
MEWSTLSVTESRFYTGNFPKFSQPKQLGTFGLEKQRQFVNDDRNIKFYKEPFDLKLVHFNLSTGHDKAIVKNEEVNEKLDNLLKWILTNREKVVRKSVSQNQYRLSYDFVCYRGLLTILACSPYEHREGWIICATKFRGTIYLCAFNTPEVAKNKRQMTNKDKLACYWGRKFEHYVTSDSPNGQTREKEIVNENEEFCIACETKLKENRILYGAEIDCIDPTQKIIPNQTSHYIELKTNREIAFERQDRNFRRYKLLKWWAQSFLVGIPKLVVGFRDDDGIVSEVANFEVKALPRMAEGLWNPCICFHFVNEFLNYVKKCVTKDDPKIVYKFEWNPKQNVSFKELDTRCTSEYNLLPEWYATQIFKDLNIS